MPFAMSDVARCGAASPPTKKKRPELATVTPLPIPIPEIQARVLACCEHLESACSLARKTVVGPEKGHAAKYLLDTLKDLRAEFRRVRKLAREENPL